MYKFYTGLRTINLIENMVQKHVPKNKDVEQKKKQHNMSMKSQQKHKDKKKKNKKKGKKQKIQKIIEHVELFNGKRSFIEIDKNGNPKFMNFIPEDKQQKYENIDDDIKSLKQVGTNEDKEPVFLVWSKTYQHYYFVDNENNTYNFGDKLGEFTLRNFGWKLGGNSKNLRESRRNFSKRKTYKGAKRRISNNKTKRTLNKRGGHGEPEHDSDDEDWP